jgi:hypothetical protein
MKSSPSKAQRSHASGIYTIRICFGFAVLLLAQNCSAETKRPASAGLFIRKFFSDDTIAAHRRKLATSIQ